MMKKIFALTLLSSSLLFASSGVGNGGDVLVCKGEVIGLLDSYEAKKIMDLNINLVGETKREMLLSVISKLEKKDIATAKKLKEYSMELIVDIEEYDKAKESDETSFRGIHTSISPDNVGEISDSKHRRLPRGCELRQLVSQVNPERRRVKRYEINSVLWNKLTEQDQVMTVLHEAWYRIFIENGAKNSLDARYMNGLVASDEFEEVSFVEYFKDLATTKLFSYQVDTPSSLFFEKSISYGLKDIDYNFDEETDSVCLASQKIRVNIKKVAPVTTFHLGLAKFKFKEVCFKNSYITKLVLPGKLKQKRINFVMRNYLVRTNSATDGEVLFHENGAIKEIKGFNFQAMFKLFYNCNGVQTFTKENSRCKGPYRSKKNEVRKIEARSIKFDKNEKPMDYLN